jgi:hypothetical protein
MSLTGIEVFDTTIHRTNSWLKEVMLVQGREDQFLEHIRQELKVLARSI